MTLLKSVQGLELMLFLRYLHLFVTGMAVMMTDAATDTTVAGTTTVTGETVETTETAGVAIDITDVKMACVHSELTMRHVGKNNICRYMHLRTSTRL